MIRIKGEKKQETKVKLGVTNGRSEDDTDWTDEPTKLMGTVRTLERQHSGRVSENRRYARLYYAKPYVSADQALLNEADGKRMFDILRRHGANLTSEVIDAGIALLCRRLSPKVAPIAGDNVMMQGCKRISRVIEGVAESSDWLGEFTEVARAGMIGDAGFALIDTDEATGEVKAWKLDQNYVFWPLDGTPYPRTVCVVIPVPKAKLIAQFPDKAEQIRKLPTWRPRKVVGVDELGGSASDVDTVAVATAWSLALGPKTPGKKVVAAGDDLILHEGEWKFDFHQVIKFSWKRNATGWAGVPLTRSIAPYDLTNKRLLNRTLSALDGAVPWLVSEEENDIEAVSDIEFQRITYPRGGQAPTVVVPNPVSTQSLDRMEANRAGAFREAHINENAAQGQAPAGLKSAVAQFAWADAVQTVLLPQQEGWQKLWRDAAHVVVAIMATNKKARFRVGDTLEEVELPDLPRDSYKITFGLVSGLSLTVSGRLEQLQQIQAALPNKLDNEDVLKHIGLVDTQQLADRLLAPRELAEFIVQTALNDGKAITPPRMMGEDGLKALYRIACQEYCGALKRPRNYYKRDHLETLRKVALITEFLIQAPPKPIPAQAPVGGQPPMPAPLPEIPMSGAAAAPIMAAPSSTAPAAPPQ